MHKSNELPTVASGTAFIEAVNTMTEKGFGVLGVISPDGKLAGMVTDGDLRRYLTSGRKAQTIDEIMTRSPVTASPDTLAAEVLRTLNEKKKTQMFVLDAGKPVGIIHLHDLLKAGLA
jgi:arabinose-5-phosphate isomerase